MKCAALLVLRIHDGRAASVPAAAAPSVNKVADDARARQLGRLEPRRDEGDVDVKLVGHAALSASLPPKATLEVPWREAVGDALENVGSSEHLTEAGVVPALARLDLLDRVGLEHGSVAVRCVCPRNFTLESLEEVAVRSGEEVASHGGAALVKATLVQLAFALGNALLEGGDVCAEHLCFFGKELCMGLIRPSKPSVISIFSIKQKLRVFVLL